MPPLFFLEAIQVAALTAHHTPAHLLPIEALLRRLNYSQRAIGEVIAWVDEQGTAEGCPSVDDGDRSEVEGLIPARMRAEVRNGV